MDDHVPFLLAGIPSIDLIDFSYEFADTAEDTPTSSILPRSTPSARQSPSWSSASRASLAVLVEP